MNCHLAYLLLYHLRAQASRPSTESQHFKAFLTGYTW